MVHTIYLRSNVNSGVTGKASRDFDKSTNNNLEWVTNFSTRIKDHQIRAMVGYSYNYGVSSGMEPRTGISLPMD